MSKLPRRRFRKNLPKKRRLRAMQKANPTGRLNRIFFILGGIGTLIIAIVTFFLGWSFSIPRHNSFGSYPWWLVFNSLLMVVGMTITSFGFYGFYRNYGTLWGLITSTVLVIGSFFVFFLVFYSIHEMQWWQWENVRFGLDIEFGFALLVIAFCLVLMGVVLLNVKNLSGVKTLSAISGTLNIVVSLLFFSIFPASRIGIAWFGFSASSIIMAVVFFSAKLYSEEYEEKIPHFYPLHNDRDGSPEIYS
jgi:hypothetical protein